MLVDRLARPLWLVGLILALCLVAVPGALAAPPVTFTETEQGVTETFPETEGICGVTGTVTITYNSVFHITEFEDGRFHVTGTSTGRVLFAGNNGVTYTGHFTQWFGENGNTKNANGTFTFSVQLRGDDGSSVRLTLVEHFTVNANGEPTAEFQKAICH